MNSTCSTRAVDQHFAGSLSPSDERALREHLPTCPECTRYYARHQLLARLDPQALGAQERLARGLGLRRPARVLWVAGLSLAAATALALVVILPGGGPDQGFVPRGTGAGPEVQLTVFRISEGRAIPVDETIAAGDELAFAYENRVGKRHLLLFGQDDQQRVYWFFPAWTDESQNPQALTISPTQRPTELREAVRHRFAGSQLTVRAIFTDEPLTVREVERRLAERRVPVSDGALEQTRLLRVAGGPR